MNPEPHKEHNACSVCNCYFEDFKDHINSKQHKENQIGEMPTRNAIEELVREIKLEFKKGEKKRL